MSKDFKIDNERYLELKHFCRQYKMWNDCLDAFDGTSKPNFSGEKNSKSISNPTVRTVERREEYLKNIELVENAAKLADEKLSGYLIKAVTEGISYFGLRTYEKLPACQKEYYEGYKRFFFILDKTRK